MHPYLAEIVGTMLLILLGDGVVANVVLSRTKGNSGGWIVITAGWAMGVFIGVTCVGRYSGAHLNPAVTFALALSGQVPWADVPGYVAAQMIGGALGALLVFLHFYPHWRVTSDPDAKLAVFCTGPAIRFIPINFLCEVIGTFVLVLSVLYMSAPNRDTAFKAGLGALDALPVALVVLAIGLSLGGTTGYAINPARDLAPRFMHAILPIHGKRDSDWSYAWVPVLGPLAGAALAVGVYVLLGRSVTPLT